MPSVPTILQRLPNGSLRAASTSDPVVLPTNAPRDDWLRFCTRCGLDRPLLTSPQSAIPGSGWVFALSFELGEVFEPAIQRTPPHRARMPSGWPLALAWRVEGWHTPPATPQPWSATMRSPRARQRYASGVTRCLKYIHAGDVYQINLAHPLSGVVRGDSLSFAHDLLLAAKPTYGLAAGWRDPSGVQHTLASASPELFLAFDPATRLLSTRPMKGTRRATDHAASHSLRTDPKEQAELAMIIDLMRNDLGRVCDVGSVRVDAPRTIEAHGTGPHALFQATGTVCGTPRERLTWREALEATFPPGSVTGAPKIRAIQIIRELEPLERGPYCGAIGFVGDDGHATWSVSIRTAMLRQSQNDQHDLRWWVGAGIVADSVPEREWQETLDKASALHAALATRTIDSSA